MAIGKVQEENFDKFRRNEGTTKWSGDLDYINRFNYFIGNASVNISMCWRTNEFPFALLDATMQMEQAFLDVSILKWEDDTKPIRQKIITLQAKILEQGPSAIHAYQIGNANPLFNLKNEVNDLFFDIRLLAHKAGLTIKQSVASGDFKADLKRSLSQVEL